jgi:hypothetical protein
MSIRSVTQAEGMHGAAHNTESAGIQAVTLVSLTVQHTSSSRDLLCLPVLSDSACQSVHLPCLPDLQP